MSYAVIPNHAVEKRQEFRMRCKSPVQITSRAQRHPMYGELQDVSTGGLRLTLNKRLKLGTEYRMYLPLYNGVSSVELSITISVRASATTSNGRVETSPRILRAPPAEFVVHRDSSSR